MCCTKSFEKDMQKLWPDDVGITVDETSSVVRMLQAAVYAEGMPIRVRPFNPNIGFALQ